MKTIVKILLALIFIWFMYSALSSNKELPVQNQLKAYQLQFTKDAIKQYEMAKRHGSAADAYNQAGLVATTFLRINDEENYKKWKKIEKEEAENANISFP
ncbi:hypothetical protein [Aquimarina sp. 2201CG5-10]|uniref:hypothetical protein n=1 Tax=Aquimarina callyspongiae TaxID=3098150 RepID=UPI002AB3C788|nr:hypothetical protein [Aquimarina sp. 2201CG5-10]MDY8138120.1 hypothetical protein [Aquimarina sp. 2201CG5-10]